MFLNKTFCRFSKFAVLIFVFFSSLTFSQINKCTPLLARIAYSEHLQITDWSCEDCKTYNSGCKNGVQYVSQAYVYNNDFIKTQFFGMYTKSGANTNIYIVFRGTVPSMIDNWIANFNYTQMAYPNEKCNKCFVHSGFYTDYVMLKSNIQEYISNTINTYPKDTFTLNFVGHSLGGAFATLAAVQNKCFRPNLSINLFTYGQPRVGDVNFARFVSQTTAKAQRVVHYADIVPHLPPQSSGYQHYNMQWWYEQTMRQFQVCLAQNPYCSNSIDLTHYSISDHSMDWYVKIYSNVPIFQQCTVQSIDCYVKINSYAECNVTIIGRFQGQKGQYFSLGYVTDTKGGWIDGQLSSSNVQYHQIVDTEGFLRPTQDYIYPIQGNTAIGKSWNSCFGEVRVHVIKENSINLKEQDLISQQSTLKQQQIQ